MTREDSNMFSPYVLILDVGFVKKKKFFTKYCTTLFKCFRGVFGTRTKKKMSDEKNSARPLPPLPPHPDSDDVSSESDGSSAYETPSDPSDTESVVSVIYDDEHQVVCDVLFAERHGDADDTDYDTDDEENVVLAELERLKNDNQPNVLGGGGSGSSFKGSESGSESGSCRDGRCRRSDVSSSERSRTS